MTTQCHCPAPTKRVDAGRAIVRIGPFLWALALMLLPKCPICGMAYLSLTGLAALPWMPGWERWWPLIFLALVLNVWLCLGQRRTR